ncbi:MAG: anti-sigma factor [Acidobacteriota bacterium]
MTAESDESFEDRLIHELLDRLSDDVTPSLVLDREPVESAPETIAREYVELLGLLPYELDTESPSSALKGRIASAVEATLVPAPSETGRGILLTPSAPGSEAVTSVAARQRASTGSPGLLALAACFAVALLGISIWQSAHLAEQRTTIEELAGRLQDANSQIADLEDFKEGLRQARNNLALVSSPGVEVCTLRPAEKALAQENAHGTLFVAADHKSWYMRLEGLVPCPLGRKHQIWFVRRDGSAVSGGLFEVEAGQGIEISSELMPIDTVAVMITLEPQGGSDSPTGPSVLYGDDVMQIL